MTDTEMIVIARGRTAEVLAWNDQQVVKLFYAEISTDSILRETQFARLVSEMNLSTPKLLGEITLGGRSGLLYERVAGRVFVDSAWHPAMVVWPVCMPVR